MEESAEKKAASAEITGYSPADVKKIVAYLHENYGQINLTITRYRRRELKIRILIAAVEVIVLFGIYFAAVAVFTWLFPNAQ